MWGKSATNQVKATAPGSATSSDLFARIGEFLERNRLGPDPVNYEFAFKVESNPTGPLATSVNALAEGGVRLTRRDIEALGGSAVVSPPLAMGDGGVIDPEDDPRAAGDAIAAKTQIHVDSFLDLVRAMHADTRGFGQELAASANAMQEVDADSDSAAIIKLTNAMIARINAAEARLDSVTSEVGELREKLEEARGNARTDPLTGLPNRRAFEEAFIDREHGNGQMFLAICDIDRFKAVNDGFGHAVGDRVLKAVGGVIAEHCGQHVVARYGGEEFIVLFTGCRQSEAHACLEGARMTAAQKRYRLRETDAPLGSVTFSAGFTEIRAGETLSNAFERADALLYNAKNDGRNNIKIG